MFQGIEGLTAASLPVSDSEMLPAQGASSVQSQLQGHLFSQLLVSACPLSLSGDDESESEEA